MNKEKVELIKIVSGDGPLLLVQNEIQEIFDQDVSVNVHFQPLPLLTAYKNLGYEISDYPVAHNKYQSEITLPVYYDLTDNQIINLKKSNPDIVTEARKRLNRDLSD